MQQDSARQGARSSWWGKVIASVAVLCYGLQGCLSHCLDSCTACAALSCAVQFAIGSVLSLIFWATGFVKPPKLDAKLVGTGSKFCAQWQATPAVLLAHVLRSTAKRYSSRGSSS